MNFKTINVIFEYNKDFSIKRRVVVNLEDLTEFYNFIQNFFEYINEEEINQIQTYFEDITLLKENNYHNIFGIKFNVIGVKKINIDTYKVYWN